MNNVYATLNNAIDYNKSFIVTINIDNQKCNVVLPFYKVYDMNKNAISFFDTETGLEIELLLTGATIDGNKIVYEDIYTIEIIDDPVDFSIIEYPDKVCSYKDIVYIA